MGTEYREIRLADIIPTADNKRKIDEKAESFIDLKSSIAAGGVRVPIHVRVHPDRPGKYDLRAGERRYRACLALGVERIPAIVQSEMDDEAAVDLTYVENKFRKSLRPLEEAAEIAMLMERFGGRVKAICERFGLSEKWVRVRANIAKGLATKWKKIFEQPEKHPEFRTWTLTHLSLIARLPAAAQLDLLGQITDCLHQDPELCTAEDLDGIINNMLRLLAGVKWDLDDETLLPKAGACSKCAKRTGHQPILWYDAADQGATNDRCTDPSCYSSKRGAWLARRAAELREKHPNLIFTANDYPGPAEAKMIAQSCGAYVNKWQFKTVKKSSKGAVPAMYVCGKSAGSLAYVKVTSGARSRGMKVKGKPTPLAERRAMLDAKRWSQVLLDLQQHVIGAPVDAVTYSDPTTGIMALTALVGNVSMEHEFNEPAGQATRTLVADTKLGREQALQWLWESVKPTLRQLLTYHGPITQTPAHLKDEAKWIAEVIGVHLDDLFNDVCDRKGFAEPKSWKNLKADGTPKAKKAAKKAPKAKKTKKAKKAKKAKKKKCRVCGCTDDNACLSEGVPCHWVEPDLCSACHTEVPL